MKKKCECRVNNKGDCKNCQDHGICLAEVNAPNYFCNKGEKENK